MNVRSSVAQLRNGNIFFRHTYLLAAFVVAIGVAIFLTQRVAFAAPGPITGTVFNDVNANGAKDAGEGAFSNVAIVNLYNSSGAYVKSRTSDSSGNFSLSGLSAGTYYVSLYNTTRASTLNSPPGLINDTNVHVEQTYGGVGAGAGTGSGPVCVGASPTYTAQSNYTSNPSEWLVGAQNGTSSGTCFGGRKADMTNTVLSAALPVTYPVNTDFSTGNAGLNTQKSVTKVVLTSNGGVSGVDFGLSTDAVTNVATSGQGSLAQFIMNANISGGAHTMRFVPGVPTNQGSGANAWWQIAMGSTSFASISNGSTTIDGRAWSNTNGTTQLDTNTGSLNGSTVGTTGYPVANFAKPELEITGDVRANSGTSLLTVIANSVTIQNVGLNSTVNYPSSSSNYILQTAGTGLTVTNSLMGVSVSSGATSATKPLSAITTTYLLSLNTSGLFKHNYIASNDSRGMQLSNVVSLVLGDFVIEDNSGPSSGVSFGSGTTRITVRHNNMPTAWLDAALVGSSLGFHTLTENTISGDRGVVLFSSSQNTITKNQITNASGSNPGVAVGNLSTGNYISQNEFGGNGGNAIDLNSDGPSTNELVSCVTLAPSLVSLANLGLARPTISGASLNSGTLRFNVGYCGVGIFNLELYKVSSGSGDSNAGEGVKYLGSLTNLSLINGTVTNRTIAVSGLSPGDKISAIVVDAVLGNTSEFGPNADVSSPPLAPSSPPDMTSGTDTGVSNSDNLTNDTTPDFTGTCTNGETVTLYIDDVAISPTQVCTGGTYTITPNSPISSGNHTIKSTFTNSTDESPKSAALNFTIDATAPTKLGTPDMTSDTDTGISSSDNITNNSQPIFTGSCTNGHTVTLFVDGVMVGSQLCGSGSYTITPGSALSGGAHSVTVSATDAAGNMSILSDSLSITVDLVAPSVPTISSPTSGSTLSDTTPTFSGTGENGARVTVKSASGVALCTATVSGSTWSCETSTPLTDGTYGIYAYQIDIAGNNSPNSTQLNITMDTALPDAPAITDPQDGTRTNDTTPQIMGTAEANATVYLYIGSLPVVIITADNSGHWSYIPSSELAEGAYDIVATQKDSAGNESSSSSTVSIVIDMTKPTVTINKAAGQDDPTTELPIIFTVTLSESINEATLSPADFVLVSQPAGVGSPTITDLTKIDATHFSVKIGGLQNHTSVSLSLATDSFEDKAGNKNIASTSTDNTVAYEAAAPTVTQLRTNDSTPEITGTCVHGHSLSVMVNSVNYPIVCGNDDIWHVTTNTLSDSTYNVKVTDQTAGNETNSVLNQTDALIIDTVRPSVTIAPGNSQQNPTNDNSAVFTVTFSEVVASDRVGVADFTLLGTSTGSMTLQQLTALTWQVTVTAMTSGDNIKVTIDQNKVNDLAGNGNTAYTTTSTVAYDTTPPSVPVITQPENDQLFSDATPAVTGTGENGATITVLIDGQLVTCEDEVIVENGHWSCQLESPLSEGSHTVVVYQTDAAGNQSPVTSSVTFMIDTTPPAGLARPMMTAATDAGRSQTDAITNNQTPHFSGSCISPDTIKLYIDGNLETQTTCTNNVYELALQTATTGTHQVTVRAIDAAGNASDISNALSITIDVIAPAAPIIQSPPSGAQNTSVNSLNGTGEVNAIVTLQMNGTPLVCTPLPIIIQSDATWSCALSAPLTDGTYAFIATQTDTAGNGTTSATRSVTIDTTPPAALATPLMDSLSDTGVSNTDAITNDTTPTLTGSCENNTTISLYVDNVKKQTATCAGGAYQSTVSPVLSENTHSFSVTASDTLGNESDRSPNLQILIDTTAPVRPNAPDLAAASDSGRSATDEITNVTQPSFTGSCTTSDTITLYVDGNVQAVTTCPAEATYTLTPLATLTNGSHVITVRASDIAGNNSTVSSVLTITIDTAAPLAPTMISPVDNLITSDTTPTTNGTGENNARITLYVNGTSVSCDPIAIVSSGNWNCILENSLAEGTYVLTATQQDIAGNISSVSNSRTVTIDTTAPSQPNAPDMTPVTDTGSSNNDNVTNNQQPHFTGSCNTGDKIELYASGTKVAEGVCSGGSYDLSPAAPLAADMYTMTVAAVDSAGNSSSSSLGLGITIDITPPGTPSTPDLVASSDSGVSSSDEITNVTQPTFTGSCSGNVIVRLLVDGVTTAQTQCSSGIYNMAPATSLTNGSHQVTTVFEDTAGNVGTISSALTVVIDTTPPNTPTVVTPTEGSSLNDPTPPITGTAESASTLNPTVDNTPITCDEGTVRAATNGSWTCTPTNPLSENPHTIQTQATDPAGNASSPSPDRTITIDTTAPPAPSSAPDMIPSSDSGVSNTDDLTNNQQPTFTGSCTSGHTILLYVSNVLVGSALCSGGVYLVAPTTALQAGTYQMTVALRDPAGNASAQGPALSIVIDLTAPSQPGNPDMTAATDSGSSTTDNITANVAPHFIGSCSGTIVVKLRIDGTVVAQANCNSGQYELWPGSPISSGVHQASIVFEDEAGNGSTSSSTLSFTVDTAAPASPIVTSPAEGLVTNNPKPQIVGTAEPNSTLVLLVDGTPLTCTTTPIQVSSGGTWSCTPISAMSDGSHAIRATVTDLAGNTSVESSPRTITIDTVPPPRPTRPDLADSSDSGVSNTDNITNVTKPQFTGSCSAGETITFRQASIALGQLACANGTYSYTLQTALTDGSYGFTVLVTDLAGNTSSTSFTLNITIKTFALQPSTPYLADGSDSGFSQTDNITAYGYPTITGVCNAFETVFTYVDNVLQNSAPCMPPFYSQPNNQLFDGTHTVKIKVTDIAGNLSDFSPTRTILIDSMAPGNPTVNTPAANVTPTVTTTTYTTSGTTEPNAQLIVWENNVNKCSTFANSSGAWSCTLTGLTNGTHTYVYSANDVAGNTGALVVNRKINVNHP